MIFGKVLKVSELTETAEAVFLLPLSLLFTYFLSALLVLVLLSIISYIIRVPAINIYIFDIIVSFVAALLAADLFMTMALGKNAYQIILSYLTTALLIGIIYAVFSLPMYAMFGGSVVIVPLPKLITSIVSYSIEGIIHGLLWGVVPLALMLTTIAKR